MSCVLLPHSRYKVNARICNHRKKILSLPKCGWESPGRTRTLGTSGNDEEGESEMDGGISVQYRNVLPTIITGSIAVTRQSFHYPASSQYFDNLSLTKNFDSNVTHVARNFCRDCNCHRMIFVMKISTIIIVGNSVFLSEKFLE